MFYLIVGLNPVWNEQLGFKLTVPDLALIQFLVRESTDTFLGQFTLPFRCMQQGRHTTQISTD